jgi:hypothetical protein
MVQVSVYTHYGTALIRVGRLKLLPDPDSPDPNILLEPLDCVPDRVAITIKAQLLAGAKYGDVDHWHWQTENC